MTGELSPLISSHEFIGRDTRLTNRAAQRPNGKRMVKGDNATVTPATQNNRTSPLTDLLETKTLEDTDGFGP